MKLTQSYLKKIIKEELSTVLEDYDSMEMEQVSDLERAMEIANQLEQNLISHEDQMGVDLVKQLQGILADTIDSESGEMY